MTYNVTKEQIELFNKHFRVIEEAEAILEFSMDIINPDLDINSLDENEVSDYLTTAEWTQTYTSFNDHSADYSIQDKKTETHLKSIDNLCDIFDFIQNDMSNYLDQLEP